MRHDQQYLVVPTEEVSEEDEAGFDANVVYSRWLRGDFTIVPGATPYFEYWDVAVILALFCTALVVPFEVALIDADTPDALQWIGRTLDAIFTIDVVINFNVAYTLNEGQAVEKRPVLIAKTYMAVPFSNRFNAGWFWLDSITIIPWHWFFSDMRWKSVKAFRFLRLYQMFRLARVIKLFKRWHTQVGFSLALMQLWGTMMLTLGLVHWLACTWSHIAIFSEDYGEALHDTWLADTYLSKKKDISEISVYETYGLALYFCSVVLTTVGFGDIVPRNRVETKLMTATVFLTGLTWAFVVASVVDVVTHTDVYKDMFKVTMDNMNTLMRTRDVPMELQLRVRRHLHESYQMHRERHNMETIKWLSSGLQGELAIASGVDKVCDCIWYLRGSDQAVWLVEIAQFFQSFMFSPQEFLIDRGSSVSVVQKGSLVYKGKVLMRGGVVGEDMILITDALKCTVCPRALTVVEIMSLQRKHLMQVCEKHPDLNMRIRRAQIRLAVSRAIIWSANRLRYSRFDDTKMTLVDVCVKGGLLKGMHGWVEAENLHKMRSAEGTIQGLMLEELKSIKNMVKDIHEQQVHVKYRMDVAEQKIQLGVVPTGQHPPAWKCFSGIPQI